MWYWKVFSFLRVHIVFKVSIICHNNIPVKSFNFLYNDVNDCKNFLLVCEIMGEDDESEAAVTALIDVFGDCERDKRPTYTSHLEWILEMRSAMPRTDAIRMENALLEYSTGDIASAISELKILVNGGDFPALVYLAEISAAEGYLLVIREENEGEGL